MTGTWQDRRARMRAAFRANGADRITSQLSDSWAANERARAEARRYYAEHWQVLRDLRGLGVIDPGPQNPRW